MNRHVVEMESDERNSEIHPAFGMIGASRVSYGPPGTVLFDSDIQHGHTVVIRLSTATRRRDHSQDWIGADREIAEFELSEAQWASFVSSMNVGDGVPCTLRYIEGETMPALPYAPRLAHSMQETKDAAHMAFDEIVVARDAYEAAVAAKAPAAERKQLLHDLHFKIENAVPNIDYAGKVLINHTENVVTKARADIEAFVLAKARQIGIEPEELGSGGFSALGE